MECEPLKYFYYFWIILKNIKNLYFNILYCNKFKKANREIFTCFGPCPPQINLDYHKDYKLRLIPPQTTENCAIDRGLHAAPITGVGQHMPRVPLRRIWCLAWFSSLNLLLAIFMSGRSGAVRLWWNMRRRSARTGLLQTNTTYNSVSLQVSSTVFSPNTH